MPPFAQANGVDCSTCHTMMPALNSYGRYIQRTAYAGLDYHLMQNHSPFWINERIRNKSTGTMVPGNAAIKTTYGNVQVDAVGYASPAITYRIEQTLWSNNIGGGNTGHIWVAYNRLFGGRGHVIYGKDDPAVPSAFAGWQDITGFSSTNGLKVGKHKYAITSSRWGPKFDYDEENFALSASYGVGSSSLVQASDFTSAPGSDKVFQWNAAYANAGKPFEFGLDGALGSYVESTKWYDRYRADGIYAQRDPFGGVPGLFAYYQMEYDSNPGQLLPGAHKRSMPLPATSHSYAFEIYQPLFNDQIMLGIRPLEESKTPFGPIKQYGNVDFAARVPHLPYLFFYAESAYGAQSSAKYGVPTWQWGFRWAGPVSGPITRIF